MKGKTVLLPREWNDPGVPPENDDPVLVLLKDKTVTGAIWDYGTWEPVGVGPTYDMSGVQLQDEVIGWWSLVQQ